MPLLWDGDTRFKAHMLQHYQCIHIMPSLTLYLGVSIVVGSHTNHRICTQTQLRSTAVVHPWLLALMWMQLQSTLHTFRTMRLPWHHLNPYV